MNPLNLTDVELDEVLFLVDRAHRNEELGWPNERRVSILRELRDRLRVLKYGQS